METESADTGEGIGAEVIFASPCFASAGAISRQLHQSIKVTERHDAPWVKARQDLLEAMVRSTFKHHNFATVNSEQRDSQIAR
jgi:hypothetical protein